MTDQEKRREIIKYWIEKAQESLDAAYDEMAANRLSFAVNRIYYACFYAVSAVLLEKNLEFKKHSGVRAAFHKHLIKSGQLKNEYGKLYDELFEARQRGDYIELVTFQKRQVEDWLTRTKIFIQDIITYSLTIEQTVSRPT